MRLLLLALLAACSGPDDKPADDTAPADADTDTDADTDADSDTDADTDTDTDVTSADADGDGALPSIDCDDTDPTRYPGAEELCNEVDDDCDGAVDEDAVTMYADADGDGYGDPSTGMTGCEFPASYVLDDTDCDDGDADVHPGAAEPDCADPTDYDCDGDVAYADEDGDGTAACEDCDDDDDTSYPGAAEDCDGVDNDCDGTADDGVTTTFYGDADADGYGGTRFTDEACSAAAGFVATSTDCDDLDAADHPGATETCDGEDDDCDGTTDDNASDASTWYGDDDSDGYGDAGFALQACDQPAGFAAVSGDCYTRDDTIYPGAPEACDGVDHDCDGSVNEDDSVDADTYYLDLDGDGAAGSSFSTTACSAPFGFYPTADDCDDSDDAVYVGATESCNSIDDDCDGSTDESGATGETTWYRDADGDNYGSPTTTRSACTIPSGYLANDDDCDDTDATVSPLGTEICNDVDDDCDGTVDDTTVGGTSYYPDDDGDGFGDDSAAAVTSCSSPVGYRLDNSDCDDTDLHVHPYAYEDTNDLVDNDCDGDTDTADTDTRRTGPSGNDSGTSTNFGITFPFCGTNYTSGYMQTNGRITFGSNDTDATETSVDLGSDITVAGLWDDLRSSSSSTMEWMEFSDAVAFYWIDVPEATGSTATTFTIVLFDDGRILYDYGDVGLNDGLAGWSCGIGSVGSETDLSSAMDALGTGRWGIGSASENAYWEVFGSDNDLDQSVVRLCGNPGGGVDPCDE